jgi:B9 domain-containing protein 1
VISVYSIDSLGRDVVCGYASVLVPVFPGKYTRYVNSFAPISSSLLQSFVAWITGNYPEFYDSKFVSHGVGREVTRTKSTGVIKVVFNISTRGMASFGYALQDHGAKSRLGTA